jgi:hypothetical protein
MPESHLEHLRLEYEYKVCKHLPRGFGQLCPLFDGSAPNVTITQWFSHLFSNSCAHKFLKTVLLLANQCVGMQCILVGRIWPELHIRRMYPLARTSSIGNARTYYFLMGMGKHGNEVDFEY